MLKKRIITALILLAVLLSALFYMPYQWFIVAIIIVFLVAAWEWANLSSIEAMSLRIVYAAVIALMICVSVWYTGLDQSEPSLLRLRDLLGIGCTWWAIALLWVMTYPGSAVFWKSIPARMIMGALVLIPAALSLIFVSSVDTAPWLFIFIVGVVISADVGAYFFGVKFGKRKLAPHVSPGKSWAGVWGGMASSLVFALIVSTQYEVVQGLSVTALLAITAFCTLASVLGDLLESMVKRHRGIKDSSQLLPGHGGVLDRIDGLTAAVPVFSLLMILLQGR